MLSLCMLVAALHLPWRVKFECLDLLTNSNNGPYIVKVKPETLFEEINVRLLFQFTQVQTLPEFKSSVTQDCILNLFHKTTLHGFENCHC